MERCYFQVLLTFMSSQKYLERVQRCSDDDYLHLTSFFLFFQLIYQKYFIH